MVSKMASLMDLVTQNQPHFQTRQALLVIGLQNDFCQPDGRLPVDISTGFLERIETLIPKFRELSGNVIWVQTLYEADRIATGPDTGEGDALVVGGLIDGDESSTEAGDEELGKEAALLPAQSRSSKHKQRALDLLKRVSARRKTLPKEIAKASVEEDDELFLLKSENRTPACVPGTSGAEFVDPFAGQIQRPADSVIKTTNYSAFQGTNLLMTLRARLVTELFICGCITNVSVLATVIDAARHGVKICVVEDCLGFCKENRHDLALRRMDEFFDAYLVNSEEILSKEPLPTPKKPAKPDKDSQQALELALGKLSLGETKKAENELKTASERGAETSDKEFSDLLVRGAQLPAEEQEPKPQLVKTNIRMRTGRTKKKKKAKEEVNPEEPTTSIAETQPTSSQPLPTPQITKAGSVVDLREGETKQRALKNAASVPALSTKGEEKEKNRLSDFSDRVRLSLARAPKSDESKRVSLASTKAASTISKHEDKASVKQDVTTPAKTDPVTETEPAETPSKKTSKIPSLANLPVLGPADTIAEGDSRIIYDFFPADVIHPSDPSKPLKDLIFLQLYNEVRWQKMLHQQGEVPRLVCCQGEFGDDGSMPVYRHPADQTLPLLHFSPKVHVIRKQAEKLVGHPLNHVLIQLYRSGNDFISEHSDKTLDIVQGSSIVNVSFGSQRTMRLRTKKPHSKTDEPDTANDATDQRKTQRVPMPHNSMFVLDLESNSKWLHGIQPDKRLASERSAAETSYNGMRISLTFRHIGTFLDAKETTIWGQGATSKTARDAADVINNDEEEAHRLITAFSHENHNPDFSWQDHYGDGFDVLHLHTSPPPDMPLLFASNNIIETQQAMIGLAETNISCTVIDAPQLDMSYELDRQVTFRDNDTYHTEIHMSSSILLYLDRYHALDSSPASNPVTANAYPVMLLTAGIIKAWLNRRVPGYEAELRNLVLRLEEEVGTLGGPFVAGSRFSIADAYVWPVVHVLVGEWEGWDKKAMGGLEDWYRKCWKKKGCVKKVVGVLAGGEGDGGK
ncbi:2OG-FeII Oxy 2 multi-domain protein [Pyrenophora teres f. teres]|uniref:2OG-FeII Oxy 2 multi-domain protein n=1 Tax=Pyrenophora teres f. teres TaxID=97479 RepID=A0A6S6VU53_9PLEO|nr:2OG-FeII Oxy 2 multi-domain protein [Pyrenophora teres f. teres]